MKNSETLISILILLTSTVFLSGAKDLPEQFNIIGHAEDIFVQNDPSHPAMESLNRKNEHTMLANMSDLADAIAFKEKDWSRSASAVVTDFGADPAGVLDSTEAIQRAIDSIPLGTVYFPSGLYKVTDTIFLKSNICIIGESKENTFICPTLSSLGTEMADINNGVKAVFSFDDTTKQASNIGMQNISFDCLRYDDNTKISCACLMMRRQLDNLYASNIAAYGAQSVILIRGGSNYYFNNISNDGTEKTVPYRCENILSIVSGSEIIADGLYAKDVAEIVDLSSCCDVIINNVIGRNMDMEENGDEAIDIGGSHSIIVDNVIADGYYSCIKLKEEGKEIKTYDIQIRDCIFKNFFAYGIEFLTNYELNGYVIENVVIDNCVFETEIETARGIFNGEYPRDYGVKNIKISNCTFCCQTFAIYFSSFYNVHISDCDFYGTAPYSVIMFSPDESKDLAKNNQIMIDNCTLCTELTKPNANYINCKKVTDCQISNNRIIGSRIGYGIYFTDIIKPIVYNNTIGYTQIGIMCLSTEQGKPQFVGIDINNNSIMDCDTGIQITIFEKEYQETANYGLKINDNSIRNTEMKTYGIRLSARTVPMEFDHIFVSDNEILNTQTAVFCDDFIIGQHSRVDNFVFNSSTLTS